MKKVLEGKHFADVKEEKQKMVEAPKDNKIDEFKNCSEQWERKVSIGVLHQVESTLKVTEFKHVRLNTQFFINGSRFGGGPPSYVCQRALGILTLG